MIPAEKSKVNPNELPKKIEKVFIAGSMTGWGSIEMVRTKGDAYYCVIIDCHEGNVFYKFCVDGEWTIDYSMVRLLKVCISHDRRGTKDDQLKMTNQAFLRWLNKLC